MYELETIQMQNVGIKPSKQRLLILEYLNRNKNLHLTAEDIFANFRNTEHTVSIATIYNTLDLFKDNNLVSYVKMSNGEYKYEVNCDNHIHFECTKCGTIFNLPSLDNEFEKTNPNFKIEESHVLFKGICPECKK